MSASDASEGFEIFRHDCFLAFGVVSVSDFYKLKVTLESDIHEVTGHTLEGQWDSSHFRFLNDGD